MVRIICFTNRFGWRSLLSSVVLVIGDVSCFSSHCSIACFSYVNPSFASTGSCMISCMSMLQLFKVAQSAGSACQWSSHKSWRKCMHDLLHRMVWHLKEQCRVGVTYNVTSNPLFGTLHRHPQDLQPSSMADFTKMLAFRALTERTCQLDKMSTGRDAVTVKTWSFPDSLRAVAVEGSLV